MDTKQIAGTIQQQLKATVGIEVVWSWGQNNLLAIGEDTLKSWSIDNGLGGLMFTVQGHHHKGQVLVSLNGTDTYDVFICNVANGEFTVVEKSEGMYFDEFGDWIDRKVERLDTYK